MTHYPTPRFLPESGARQTIRREITIPVAIKIARVSDRQKLLQFAAAFRKESGSELRRSESRAIGQLLSEPDHGRAYLISAHDRVIGHAVLCYGFSIEYGGRDAFLDEIYITPGARGQGIGGQVLKLLEAEATADRVRALHLEVLEDHVRVESFYRRAGFADRNSTLMTKRLTVGDRFAA
ncbi:MAG: GNAT family N-acetyltransferase [Hyphomicrobiales bacterium]|nr:GNAT family N-acetyltransferase [Hyphomicrobiales bacterium]